MQLAVQLLLTFVILFSLFTVLERLFPAVRDRRVFREGFGLDVMYLILAPTVNAFIKKISALAVVALVAVVIGLELDGGIVKGYGPVARQPDWLIVIEISLLDGFIGYWVHRYMHQGFLWKIHAIHHSSRRLDWLSSVRNHPFNQAIAGVIPAGVLVAVGFPLGTIAVYMPLILIYAVLLHANVPWDFGPLRHVIASPRFHRWHHTTEAHGINKNFAGLLPVFDLMFGTFHMPKGQQPQAFGIVRDDVPASLLGQLAYPFKSSNR